MNQVSVKENQSFYPGILLQVAFFILAACFHANAEPAQSVPDTVSITLPQAEERFLRGNVQLLAAKFNISAARAGVLQARLWNNPNIAIEQNIYNQKTGRYFDFTKTGNTEIAVQQLFLLAGKRDKQIQLAEANTKVSERTFEDLLRNLTLELRTDLYDLYFLQQSLKFYDQSLPSLRRTVDATQRSYQTRSILLSEVLRLKSLLFSLENERLGIAGKITSIEADLAVLLRDTSASPSYFLPSLPKESFDSINVEALPLQQALSMAIEHRPDYQLAAANLESAQTNLSLQQALAVPDVTIGGRWSRAGGYIPEYYAISVAVDLPFFNRNQGNIEAAESTLESTKLAFVAMRQAVEKDVATAYQKALESDRLYKSFDPAFTAQYQTLVTGMITNYERRNISIIEFTDFFESYRTSMLQVNQLQNDRLDAIESLNYAVGTTVIRP